jgi:GntR family transcriptional regulator
MVAPAVTLDRNAEVPVGTQLAWILRAQIASGELRSGDRLPGARELATIAGVNANTVRSVYARLEEEGLIEAQHGRGTFVATDATQGSVGELVARTLERARDAGVDPRELAEALYMHASLADPKPSRAAQAAQRRELRDEIAELERALAHLEVPRADPKPGAAGQSRLLSATELRAIRDDLAAQLAAAQETDAAHRAVAAEHRRTSGDTLSVSGHATGPQRWELSLGHGRWTIPLPEG